MCSKYGKGVLATGCWVLAARYWPMLVIGGVLYAIDDEDIHRAFARFKLKTELLPQSGEDRWWSIRVWRNRKCR